MKPCPKGHKMPDDARYCGICGSQIVTANGISEKRPITSENEAIKRAKEFLKEEIGTRWNIKLKRAMLDNGI
jgi:hypothetical protein